MIFRWASPAEVREHMGDMPQTVRARVAEKDGRVVAIGGYTLAGTTAFLFSKIVDGGAKDRVAMAREALRFMAEMRFPAVCIADECIPGSRRFLTWLGFVSAGRIPEGEVFAWRA